MEPKVIKEIEIVRWIVRVEESESGKQCAHMVGFDAGGNEYSSEYQVYYAGEYHDVDENIIWEKPV